MSQKLLKELKKKLPYQYGKLLAANSSQISARQIKAVFNGETKDPEKILKVVRLAEAFLKKNAIKKRRVEKKIKTIIPQKVK